MRKCSVMTSARKPHTSQLLRELLERHEGDEIRLKDLLQGIDDRAFGLTLLICALPEALPLPIAGVSAIIGIPLVLVSAQLAIGFRRPWLPSWIENRSFKRTHFEQVIRKMLRYLEKLEYLLKPRWRFFTQPPVERLIGLLLLLLAIVILLPIPFGNILPAIVIVVISLGMIEKDGLTIAIGAASGTAILALMTGAILLLLSTLMTATR